MCVGARVNNTWLDTNTLALDWTDKFTSSTPLGYEITLGTQKGSGSIVMWAGFSSDQTTFELSDNRLIRNMDYFVSLVAIGYNGLSTIANQVVAGIPLTT